MASDGSLTRENSGLPGTLSKEIVWLARQHRHQLRKRRRHYPADRPASPQPELKRNFSRIPFNFDIKYSMFLYGLTFHST
jgi:hypothetical protein